MIQMNSLFLHCSPPCSESFRNAERLESYLLATGHSISLNFDLIMDYLIILGE